jgi:hypothetical protein
LDLIESYSRGAPQSATRIEPSKMKKPGASSYTQVEYKLRVSMELKSKYDRSRNYIESA